MNENGTASLAASGSLPRAWSSAPLLDVAEINPTNPTSIPADDAPVSLIPMAAVEAMTGHVELSERRLWKAVRKGYTRFQDGDVLVAKITPCMENGKIAVARQLLGGVGAGSTEFHVLRPTAALSADLLRYYVLQEDFRKAARAKMTGTAGQLRVPSSFLQAYSLPVPPLPEQHRIVEAIESYFSRLDDAVATLERVQRNLNRYRASVLKAAVEGRLVSTEAELARAEGRDYEPASVLLERILAERRRRWEASGRKGKYQEPVAPDTTDLTDLPEGWCWTSLDHLSVLVRNGYSKAPQAEGSVPILRICAVRPLSVDFTDVRFLPGLFEQYEQDLVQPGDLLFTRYNGSPALVGVSGLVRNLRPPDGPPRQAHQGARSSRAT